MQTKYHTLPVISIAESTKHIEKTKAKQNKVPVTIFRTEKLLCHMPGGILPFPIFYFSPLKEAPHQIK